MSGFGSRRSVRFLEVFQTGELQIGFGDFEHPCFARSAAVTGGILAETAGAMKVADRFEPGAVIGRQGGDRRQAGRAGRQRPSAYFDSKNLLKPWKPFIYDFWLYARHVLPTLGCIT
jgi:hypothetical protein